MNPSPQGDTLPSGFAELSVPANADTARIHRTTYALKAIREPMLEQGVWPLILSAQEFVRVGMKGSGSRVFAFIYDPLGAINPGVANGNWWAVYDDNGPNPPLWTDTGIAYAITTYFRLEVAFELNVATGKLWCFWRVETGGSVTTTSVNMFAAGGTYEATALASRWDFDFYLDALGGGAGGEKLLADFYKIRQHRDYV
jgi:hypothetical protein